MRNGGGRGKMRAMNSSDGAPGSLPPSLQQWLQQGEMLYASALKEYHAMEAQLEDLERKLAAKRAEVNQIASVVGKSPVEGGRRLSAQLVTSYAMDDGDRDRPLPGTQPLTRALPAKPRGVIPPPPARVNP